MRKGLSETAALAVVSFVMVATLSLFAVNNALGVSEFILSETTETVAARVESGVYAVDSMEKAKLEMEFQSDAGYKIYSEGGEKYLEYNIDGFYPLRSEDPDNTVNLEEPYGTSYVVERNEGDPAVNKICIEKNSDIVISGGGC